MVGVIIKPGPHYDDEDEAGPKGITNEVFGKTIGAGIAEEIVGRGVGDTVAS